MCRTTVALPRPAESFSWSRRPARFAGPYLGGFAVGTVGTVARVNINHTAYRLVEVTYEEPAWCRVADFTSVGGPRTGAMYRVTVDADGTTTCDCADAIFHHDGHDCKHIRALAALYAELESENGQPPF